jgi:hypothetical protein
MYHKLHVLANSLTRYYFSELDKLESIENGIYLLFEKGEKYENYDRIVRVGSHPSQGRFNERLQEHLLKNHRKSIVRKHIGRCFLNKANDDYIRIWNLTSKKVKKGSEGEKLLIQEKEREIEQKVSEYLKNFSIVVIPNLDIAKRRIELEAKLIATLNLSSYKHISDNWFGKYHPNSKISKSGLWNIQHLNDTDYISETDFEFLKHKTENE